MKDSFDKELDFVAGRYSDDKFDAERAVRRFHSSDKVAPRRRWMATAAAVAASVAVVFAAGYGIVNVVSHEKAAEEEVSDRTSVRNPDEAPVRVFVYEDAPVEDVLKELSEHFGCTLTTPPTEKHLTATFPDDDLDVIVSIISSVLDIDITVEK